MQTIEKISSETSDAELLVRFGAGEEDAAFSELVRRHLPLVLAVTRRRLGSSGLAEDAAQQVFIALSRKLRLGREIACLAVWLQKAAVYEASSLARKEKRHRLGNEKATDLWTRPEPAHDDPRLDRALEKLAKLIRSQGIDHDAKFCSIWLAGSLAPSGMTVSTDLITRIYVIKSAATHTLPWLPVAAAIALIGGVGATVVATRPNPPQVSVPVSKSAPTRERPATRKFAPQTSDEKLSPEIREFIALAKRDSKEALEWAKLRPGGPFRFLQGAIRALADRDLPAAEVREWLVRQACEKAAATDEKQILELTSRLEGNERRIAVGHAASLLLQRGDPRGYELLNESAVDASLLPDISSIALRDAAAAASWVRSLDAGQRRDLHLEFAMDQAEAMLTDIRSLPASAGRDRAMASVIGSLAKVDPVQARRQLEAWDGALISHWLEAVAAIAPKLPRGKELDKALATVCTMMAWDGEADMARSLVPLITNPAQRNVTRDEVEKRAKERSGVK